MKQPTKTAAIISMLITLIFCAQAQSSAGVAEPRRMENLGRGVVAIDNGDGNVYVGWRLLGTDPEDIAFNVYRGNTKINSEPITDSTNIVDTGGGSDSTYSVRAVIDGSEGEASKPAKVWNDNYLSVPIQKPPDGEVMGSRYSYSANDASIGDLDGDGEYEIVLKWEPSNSKRPPQTGFTGPHILDAYEMDGEQLWRINLGTNIRAGAAFTQFMVYDLDCDGKAELVCKTADGTIDGQGKTIGEANADWRNMDSSSRIYGKVLDGPEYLTVFDGQTGAALDTQEYIPDRYPLDGWGGIGGNGGNDDTGNRVDHFSACVAYLDGIRPSVVMIRGWYGRTVEAAWDYRDGKLTNRWVFDSALSEWEGYSGMGNHSVTVGDFDGDGKDEINVGAMAIDDDGKGLFTTGLRHGDALHASDLDPARPGQEVFGVHENEGKTVALGTPGSALYDGRTGEIIWGNNPGVDVGRGLAADIDPDYPGAECWGSPGGTRRIDTGEVIYSQTPNSTNFAIWWDDDLLRELADRTTISKWDWKTRTTRTLFSPSDVTSNNGSKATPCLTADLFGDWREEIIWRTADNTQLRIYTTTIPAKNRIYTLMHDPQYRLAVAWQNVAYNQPPHPSFYLGTGMSEPPRPNIITGD
ncbi:MAG: rhamnogalacturonan lyase [Sedimentisphaerales bacterium]|nr:rhamnogalacturonan lyase [Sedimentisphaerales bacterium]